MSAWADRNARQREPEKYGGLYSYAWIAEQVLEHGCDVTWDLGGGHGYLERFLPEGTYLNVDGAGGPLVDVVHDLTQPTTWGRVDKKTRKAIVLRHVLDHNENWRDIIAALPSWEPTVVLIVLYMPLADETHIVSWDPIGVPEISFDLEELTDALLAHFLKVSWRTEGDETLITVIP